MPTPLAEYKMIKRRSHDPAEVHFRAIIDNDARLVDMTSLT